MGQNGGWDPHICLCSLLHPSSRSGPRTMPIPGPTLKELISQG